MFDDNKYKESDLMMRSILEDAREEVPAGVWEGVSDSLDRIAGKKVVMLRWRRAAIGLSAAAAVAVGLVVNRGGEDFVPAAVGEDMIAVVEDHKTAEDAEDLMIAEVRTVKTEVSKTVKTEVRETVLPESIEKTAVHEADVKVISGERAAAAGNEKAEDKETPAEIETKPQDKARQATVRDSEEWEEEKEKRRVGTSLVLSGVAGTNGTQARNGGTGFLRQPSISTAPLKTGIKETSTKSTYGIPLSFGAGVKIDLTKKWSLGVGLNYTLLTRRFYGTYTKVDGQSNPEIQVSTDIRNIQHYLGIPVNAFYNIVDSRHLNFYTYFGGTVERCLSDKYQLTGKDITHTEKAKGVQLSANAGIGVEFLIGKHLGLYVDPSLRYYFKNGQPSSIRTAQPLMLGFEMGLRVKL